MAGLERAKEFIRARAGAYDGRIQGMLFPYQVDTCSPALLRATRKAADELGVGIEIHAGQNLLEFHEILRRHTMTPVEYLADTGLLGPDAIVGHCIISTAHHLAALPAGRDLDILARSGASVAHCPLVFARRGNALESFAQVPSRRDQRGARHRHLSARPHQRDALGVQPLQDRRARLHRGHRGRRLLRGHPGRSACAAARRPGAAGARGQGRPRADRHEELPHGPLPRPDQGARAVRNVRRRRSGLGRRPPRRGRTAT